MSSRPKPPRHASYQHKLHDWLRSNPPPPTGVLVLECAHDPRCPMLHGGECACAPRFSFRAPPTDPAAN